MKYTKEQKALAKFLGCKASEVEEKDGEYEAEGKTFLVLSDEEATKRATEYIKDSLWAFNYGFLCTHSETISKIPEKSYTKMAGELCESFNDAVTAMVDDVDYLAEDAIKSDGRGHFLNTYDNEENESDGLYIYRIS